MANSSASLQNPHHGNLDYYAILEISRDATEFAIKKAYRKLALQWHPDKNPDIRKIAEEQFKKIAEAYAVLSDPVKKSTYDETGEKCPTSKLATKSFEELLKEAMAFFSREHDVEEKKDDASGPLDEFEDRLKFFNPEDLLEHLKENPKLLTYVRNSKSQVERVEKVSITQGTPTAFDIIAFRFPDLMERVFKLTDLFIKDRKLTEKEINNVVLFEYKDISENTYLLHRLMWFGCSKTALNWCLKRTNISTWNDNDFIHLFSSAIGYEKNNLIGLNFFKDNFAKKIPLAQEHLLNKGQKRLFCIHATALATLLNLFVKRNRKQETATVWLNTILKYLLTEFMENRREGILKYFDQVAVLLKEGARQDSAWIKIILCLDDRLATPLRILLGTPMPASESKPEVKTEPADMQFAKIKNLTELCDDIDYRVNLITYCLQQITDHSILIDTFEKITTNPIVRQKLAEKKSNTLYFLNPLIDVFITTCYPPRNPEQFYKAALQIINHLNERMTMVDMMVLYEKLPSSTQCLLLKQYPDKFIYKTFTQELAAKTNEMLKSGNGFEIPLFINDLLSSLAVRFYGKHPEDSQEIFKCMVSSVIVFEGIHSADFQNDSTLVKKYLYPILKSSGFIRIANIHLPWLTYLFERFNIANMLTLEERILCLAASLACTFGRKDVCETQLHHFISTYVPSELIPELTLYKRLEQYCVDLCRQDILQNDRDVIEGLTLPQLIREHIKVLEIEAKKENILKPVSSQSTYAQLATLIPLNNSSSGVKLASDKGLLNESNSAVSLSDRSISNESFAPKKLNKDLDEIRTKPR